MTSPAWEMQMVHPDMGGRHQYHFGPRRGPGGVTLRCTSEDAERLLTAVNHALAALSPAPEPALPPPTSRAAARMDEWFAMSQAERDAWSAGYAQGQRVTAPEPAPPCRECGPGYRIGDEGCRHGEPAPETERGEADLRKALIAAAREVLDEDWRVTVRYPESVALTIVANQWPRLAADFGLDGAAARSSRQEPDTGEEGGW